MPTRHPFVVFIFTLIFIGLFFIPEETKYSLLTSPVEIVYMHKPIFWAKALLSGFMHIQLGHLVSNVVLFVLLGYYVEEKIGHLKTLFLLLASGVGALVLHVGYLSASPVKFLGASGFVFGLLAAYVKLIKKTS